MEHGQIIFVVIIIVTYVSIQCCQNCHKDNTTSLIKFYVLCFDKGVKPESTQHIIIILKLIKNSETYPSTQNFLYSTSGTQTREGNTGSPHYRTFWFMQHIGMKSPNK